MSTTRSFNEQKANNNIIAFFIKSLSCNFQYSFLLFSISKISKGEHKPQKGGITVFLILANVLGKQDGWQLSVLIPPSPCKINK